MSLMVVLASLAVLVVPSSDNRACTRAADTLQGWIAGAKNRAVRDQTPRGIRLVASNPENSNAQYVTEVQYLEQPEPYVPRDVKGNACTLQIMPAINKTTKVLDYYIARIGDASPSSPAGVPLSPNDQASFKKAALKQFRPFDQPDIFEANIGMTYRFRISKVVQGTAVTLYNVPTPGTKNCFDVYLLPGNRGINQFDPAMLGYTVASGLPIVQLNAGECRIIRQPKPVIGEEPLLLPKGTVVDMTLSSPYQGLSSTYYDVIFGARGEVVNFSGQPTLNALPTLPTQIVLWVRSLEDTRWSWIPAASSTPAHYLFTPAKKSGTGSPTLLSIDPRTGAVGAHPVDNNSLDSTKTYRNPFKFVLDNRGDSGM